LYGFLYMTTDLEDQEVRDYRKSALIAREQATATPYAEIRRALLKIGAEYERLR